MIIKLLDLFDRAYDTHLFDCVDNNTLNIFYNYALDEGIIESYDYPDWIEKTAAVFYDDNVQFYSQKQLQTMTSTRIIKRINFKLILRNFKLSEIGI